MWSGSEDLESKARDGPEEYTSSGTDVTEWSEYGTEGEDEEEDEDEVTQERLLEGNSLTEESSDAASPLYNRGRGEQLESSIEESKLEEEEDYRVEGGDNRKKEEKTRRQEEELAHISSQFGRRRQGRSSKRQERNSRTTKKERIIYAVVIFDHFPSVCISRTFVHPFDELAKAERFADDHALHYYREHYEGEVDPKVRFAVRLGQPFCSNVDMDEVPDTEETGQDSHDVHIFTQVLNGTGHTGIWFNNPS